MTTTFSIGDFEDFMVCWRSWYERNTDSPTFVHSLTDIVVDGQIRFMELERIAEDFGMGDWPENVVISIKNKDKNPESPEMIKWDEQVVAKEGYWYIVAVRAIIPI